MLGIGGNAASAVNDLIPERPELLAIRIESRIGRRRNDPANCAGGDSYCSPCGGGGSACKSPRLSGEWERKDKAVNQM